MDWLGLAGLLAAIAALIVAIYGIRDVREQVRMLITIERNRAWIRILHTLARRFVDPSEEMTALESRGEMHDYLMLACHLDPKLTIDSAQEAANKELLGYAREMVERGLAKWREDLNEKKVLEVLREWQSERNAEALENMFGQSHQSLSRPTKK